jgi:putative DNA primase/helicase
MINAWPDDDSRLVSCEQCGREACEDHVPTARQNVPALDDDEPDRLTEAGAAERLARFHSERLRYDYRRASWHLWEGHRWIPDADSAVTRLAITFARDWQREAIATITDRDRREKVISFALRLERRAALDNMLALARALKPIADSGKQWNANAWLLGCPNGVVDLHTGMLRRGHPDDRVTLATAVPFDADAPCPRWERFLEEIFHPHPELVGFIQRAVGYTLTGDTSEQCLFLGYGTGSNGKGSFINTLRTVLGDYAWNMPFATIETRDRSAIPNDLAALVSRRFVSASETNDGTRLNEARIKALTGCDPITARFLHGEFFEFEPVAKFWLLVNHKPIVRDDSHGFWRRIRLIPFTNTFAIDKTLAPALQDEAAGILAWAVRGALLWQRDGLCAPAIIVEATREYEQDSDALGAFLDEACHCDDPSASTRASELYDGYKRWADRHGLTERERFTSTMFGRKLSERFRVQKTNRGKVYVGVSCLAL